MVRNLSHDLLFNWVIWEGESCVVYLSKENKFKKSLVEYNEAQTHFDRFSSIRLGKGSFGDIG